MQISMANIGLVRGQSLTINGQEHTEQCCPKLLYFLENTTTTTV